MPMSRRRVTDPAAPIAGTRVAASAPPNWTETMPMRTSTGAGTRPRRPGPGIAGIRSSNAIATRRELPPAGSGQDVARVICRSSFLRSPSSSRSRAASSKCRSAAAACIWVVSSWISEARSAAAIDPAGRRRTR